MSSYASTEAPASAGTAWLVVHRALGEAGLLGVLPGMTLAEAGGDSLLALVIARHLAEAVGDGAKMVEDERTVSQTLAPSASTVSSHGGSATDGDDDDDDGSRSQANDVTSRRAAVLLALLLDSTLGDVAMKLEELVDSSQSHIHVAYESASFNGGMAAPLASSRNVSVSSRVESKRRRIQPSSSPSSRLPSTTSSPPGHHAPNAVGSAHVVADAAFVSPSVCVDGTKNIVATAVDRRVWRSEPPLYTDDDHGRDVRRSHQHSAPGRNDCHSISLVPAWTVSLGKCIDASPLVVVPCGSTALESIVDVDSGAGASASCDGHGGANVGGTVVYIGSHSKRFAAIDTDSGNVLWEYAAPDRIEASAALVGGGRFIAVSDVIRCMCFLACAVSFLHVRI